MTKYEIINGVATIPERTAEIVYGNFNDYELILR